MSSQPTPLGSPMRGQPARHLAEGGDAVGLEVEAPADAIAPTTATRPPGIIGIHFSNTTSVAITPRETASVARTRRDLFQRVPELDHRPAHLVEVDLRRSDAEHACELAQSHLDPDAREEADEHGSGDEVGEEPEPRDAREDQQAAGDQRGQARVREPFVRTGLEAGDAEPGDAGVHDRGGGGVTADDEVARGAEAPRSECGQQDRVEAGDHRRSGDLRVAHHLGDGERGEGHACHDVAR